MAFTFLHAADLHLDSPLRGLDRYEGAPVEELRGATREALLQLIELALSEGVAFVVISGDVFDGDWRDYGTGLFFANQMARLHQVGIPVYLIKGNHDAASRITRQLRLPSSVRTFSALKPESLIIEDHKVALHGQSFSNRAESRNLALTYPEPLSGYFNIGLLHTSLDGREGHAPYAPCSMQDLRNKGYDYWALGHVHQREVVCKEPWVVFPGNLQGRHIRENGPRGATLVTVVDGMVTEVEARALDVLRWERLVLSLSDVADERDFHRHVEAGLRDLLAQSDGRQLAVRIRLQGATSFHWQLCKDRERWTQDCRQLAYELESERVWVEKVEFRTSQPGTASDTWEGPVSEIVEVLEEMKSQPELLDNLLAPLEKLQRRTQRAFRDEEEQPWWEDSQEILQQAGDLLLAQMREGIDET